MTYDYLPVEVQALIGKEGTPTPAPVAADKGLIDHWLEVYEDANPVYSDEAYAKKSRYKGLMAPPGMLLSWTLPFYWRPRADAKADWANRIHFTLKRLLDCPEGIVSNLKFEWFIPVRPGDHLTSSEAVTKISPLKEGRLGIGHYWDIEMVVRNQKGEIVGKQTRTMFGYKKKAKA